MSSKLRIAILITLLVTLFASVAYAQEKRGSIRGTVYQDSNGDGKCVNTKEPALAGIPLKFTSTDGKTVVYLESGDDGTYGLVAVGLGTWWVAAEPGTGYQVTSKNPLEVFISFEKPLLLGVDFCVAKGGTLVSVLPESGFPIAPIFLGSLAVGASLILTGVGLEYRRRRAV